MNEGEDVKKSPLIITGFILMSILEGERRQLHVSHDSTHEPRRGSVLALNLARALRRKYREQWPVPAGK